MLDFIEARENQKISQGRSQGGLEANRIFPFLPFFLPALSLLALPLSLSSSFPTHQFTFWPW